MCCVSCSSVVLDEDLISADSQPAPGTCILFKKYRSEGSNNLVIAVKVWVGERKGTLRVVVCQYAKNSAPFDVIGSDYKVLNRCDTTTTLSDELQLKVVDMIVENPNEEFLPEDSFFTNVDLNV